MVVAQAGPLAREGLLHQGDAEVEPVRILVGRTQVIQGRERLLVIGTLEGSSPLQDLPVEHDGAVELTDVVVSDGKVVQGGERVRVVVAERSGSRTRASARRAGWRGRSGRHRCTPARGCSWTRGFRGVPRRAGAAGCRRPSRRSPPSRRPVPGRDRSRRRRCGSWRGWPA